MTPPRFFCITLLSFLSTMPSSAEDLDVYFGTTGRRADGIYHSVLDTKSGKLTQPERIVDTQAPGFLTNHPSLPVIYAVTRQKNNDQVIAYRRDKEGSGLTEMNRARVPNGDACHIAVHPSGKFLITAQYGAGTVAVFPLDASGQLSECSQIHAHSGASMVNERRQDRPHPHWVGFSPDGRYAFSPDLATDRIEIYKVDLASRSLTPSGSAKSPPGSGPRHMRFSKDGRFIYLLNELSLTVGIYAYDAQSGMARLVSSTPTLTEREKATSDMNTASEILVHPTGRFVYAANRGHNSVSAFTTDTQSGKLSRIQVESVRGDWPRNINMTPDGKWLIAGGQRSGTVSVFSINSTSGQLVFVDESIQQVPFVSCILFVE